MVLGGDARLADAGVSRCSGHSHSQFELAEAHREGAGNSMLRKVVPVYIPICQACML